MDEFGSKERVLLTMLRVIAVLAAVSCATSEPLELLPAASALMPTAQDLPPETDLPPREAGEWILPTPSGATDRVLLLPGGRLFLQMGKVERILGNGVVGLPAVDLGRARLVWAEPVDEGPATRIMILERMGDAWAEPRILVPPPGSHDRPALSPDGRFLVYVSGTTGIASVWIVPVEGGTPHQLTNRGLEKLPRRQGVAPVGFVPVPHAGPPHFENRGAEKAGARRLISHDALPWARPDWDLAWDSPEGAIILELP